MEQVGVKLIGYFIVSVCLAILIGCFVTPEWLKACGMLFGAIYIYTVAIFISPQKTPIMKTLKGCPICGADAVFEDVGSYNGNTLWTVKCTKCGATLMNESVQKDFVTKEWNLRTTGVIFRRDCKESTTAYGGNYEKEIGDGGIYL